MCIKCFAYLIENPYFLVDLEETDVGQISRIEEKTDTNIVKLVRESSAENIVQASSSNTHGDERVSEIQSGAIAGILICLQCRSYAVR